MTQTIQLNDTQWTQVIFAAPTTIISDKGTIYVSEDPNGANSFPVLGQVTLADGTYYMRTILGSFEISTTEAILTGATGAATPPVINNTNNNTVDMTGVQLPIQNNVNVPPAQPAINVQPANAAVNIEVSAVIKDIIDAMAMSAALFVAIPQGQQPTTQNIPAGKYGLRVV